MRDRDVTMLDAAVAGVGLLGRAGAARRCPQATTLHAQPQLATSMKAAGQSGSPIRLASLLHLLAQSA